MAQQMDPKLQDAFQRVVVAGLKTLYDPKTADILKKGLLRDAPVSDILAQEVVGVLLMMDDKSGMKVPKQVLVPAGMALMQDLAKFIEQAGLAKITEQDVMEAMQKLVKVLVMQYKALQASGNRPMMQFDARAPQQPAPQAQPSPTGMIGG